MRGQEVAASAGPAAVGSHLDETELRTAVAALTRADWLRLARVDARYRGGTDFRDGDLVQEALCRAFKGSRICPREVSIVKFLADAMRSIAGHRRDGMLREISFEASPATPTGEPTDGLAPADLLHVQGSDPESILAGTDVDGAIKDMLDLFPGDAEVELVIMALSLGLKGTDLYEETGLVPNRVHYVIRKIRTQTERHFPGRWTR